MRIKVWSFLIVRLNKIDTAAIKKNILRIPPENLFLVNHHYFEFTEMLKNARFIKRCKLCSRYFVLNDKRKRDFCDRPYKSNRTCKQVGAKLFYDQGMQGNDYLLAFLAEYNKVYSRRYCADGKLPEEFSGKDMSSEEFSKWAKMARQARDDYLDGKITGKEMLAKIKEE